MPKFIGRLNGLKVLNAVVNGGVPGTFGDEAQLRLHVHLHGEVRWVEPTDGLTEPERLTHLRLNCVAYEAEDIALCSCNQHRWDANAMGGLGEIRPCGFLDAEG